MQKNDSDYLKSMIVHHEAAVTMSKKYLTTVNGSSIVSIGTMARAIISAQTDEIAKMKKWLGDANEKSSSQMKM